MKKRPSSSPLKGSRSASSSWRNSLSASRTPARNAPSAIDSPARFASKAVAITVSNAAAVNTSLTRMRATTRNAGRTTRRPPTMTTATTMASFSSMIHHVPAVGWEVTIGESNGTTASIGRTARSWNKRIPNADRPCWVLSCPRSASTCRTSGVEDKESPNPTISAAVGCRPRSHAPPPSNSVHIATCAEPRPKTMRLITHSRVGCSSRPMMNRSSTTPNSATCITSPTFRNRRSPHGPMTSPAAT